MPKRVSFSETNSLRRFDSNEIKEDDIVIMKMNEKERKFSDQVHGIMYYNDKGELVVNSNYETLFYIENWF